MSIIKLVSTMPSYIFLSYFRLQIVKGPVFVAKSLSIHSNALSVAIIVIFSVEYNIFNANLVT